MKEYRKLHGRNTQHSEPDQVIDDCIKAVHLSHYQRLYEQHRLKADELERMGDSGFLQELAESQRIKNEISKLRNQQ